MSRTSFCEFVYIFVIWLYAFYQFCTQFITYIFILPTKYFQGNMFSVMTNCNKMKLCCPFKTSNTRQYLKNAIYTPFKVNLKLLHIFIPGFLLIKISYLELVEPFHYGINFVTHDDTVLHLKASVFGTSPSKLALYLIIYYIEMDLSTRKNGKIRPKMKRWNENFRFLLISIIA